MDLKPLTPEQVREQSNRESKRFMDQNALYEAQKAKALTAQKLFDAAKLNGQWIYDPQGKTWHTPEEFVSLYGSYYYDHPLFYRVKIKSPLEGLKAGYKQLDNLHSKLQQFNEKVIAYYSRLPQL